MKKLILAVAIALLGVAGLLFSFSARAEETYFPPTAGVPADEERLLMDDVGLFVLALERSLGFDENVASYLYMKDIGIIIIGKVSSNEYEPDYKELFRVIKDYYTPIRGLKENERLILSVQNRQYYYAPRRASRAKFKFVCITLDASNSDIMDYKAGKIDEKTFSERIKLTRQ